MGKIRKLKGANITQLNNAEYLNYFKAIRYIMPEDNQGEVPDDLTVLLIMEEDSTCIGVTKEQKMQWDADCKLLTDLVNQSRISNETAYLADLDAKRNEHAVFLTTEISQGRKSPIEAYKMAATKLYNIIKPYIGLYRLPNQQETQQIYGLIADLEKPENITLLTTLHLTEVVANLKDLNLTYSHMSHARSNSRANAITENSKVIRQRLDELYEEVTLTAFATNIVNPSEKSELFIKELNNLTEEVKASYNLRMGVAKSKQKPGEAPDDL